MMSTQKNNPLSWLYHVVIPLFVGGFIYAAWRSPALRFGRWIEGAGLAEEWSLLRSVLASWRPELPDWFLYSVPDALWAYAFGWGSSRIWGETGYPWRRGFHALGLLLAVGAEIGQGIGVVPGIFDPLDLFGSAAAYSLGALMGRGKRPAFLDYPWVAPIVDFWLIARPAMLPSVGLLPVLGAAFACWDLVLPPRHIHSLTLLLVGVGLLHVGTMLLNALLDRDSGEILWAQARPVPRFTMPVALGTLTGALCIAVVLGGWPGACLAVCVALAVVYSAPSIAWKAHPVGGPFVNWLGYGVACPVAGFSVIDTSVSLRAIITLGIFSVAILAVYFIAQSFQVEEDRQRGYRTLVATHGPETVLLLTRRLCEATSLVFFSMAALGWYPRVCLLAAPFVVGAIRSVSAGATRVDAPWAAGVIRRWLNCASIVVVLVLGNWAYELMRFVAR